MECVPIARPLVVRLAALPLTELLLSIVEPSLKGDCARCLPAVLRCNRGREGDWRIQPRRVDTGSQRQRRTRLIDRLTYGAAAGSEVVISAVGGGDDIGPNWQSRVRTGRRPASERHSVAQGRAAISKGDRPSGRAGTLRRHRGREC